MSGIAVRHTTYQRVGLLTAMHAEDAAIMAAVRVLAALPAHECPGGRFPCAVGVVGGLSGKSRPRRAHHPGGGFGGDLEGALFRVRCLIGITQQRTLGVLLLPAGFGALKRGSTHLNAVNAPSLSPPRNIDRAQPLPVCDQAVRRVLKPPNSLQSANRIPQSRLG
jgi:hypothetical protein